MKKAIEVSVLRVSSNGKYIEFIINCPKDYYFTDFIVGVYGGDDKYSLKDCLFEAQLGDQDAIYDSTDRVYYHNKQEYSGQFKLEDIDVFVPEMFEIHLEAHHNSECPGDTTDPDNPFKDEHKDECIINTDPITVDAYISDVSQVYSCLMDDILKIGTDLCTNEKVQDELIRNYLILYAHREAMNMKEPQEAKKYFTLLQNCFNGKCGNKHKGCSVCGGKDASKYIIQETYKPSNCGCRR